jgi:hypothetical protein
VLLRAASVSVPALGCMFHSDRGRQCTGRAFGGLLKWHVSLLAPQMGVTSSSDDKK